MDDLLFPSTDVGVFVQLSVLVALSTGITWRVRRERALVLLTIGVSMLVIGWFGLRALH